MHIDFRQLRSVVRVAEELSFSRAADQLNISQPALSAQVRRLEDDLGLRVFDRSTRRVAITPAGRRFLAEARKLVDEGERLERFAAALRRADRTHLAIGTAIYTIDFPERIRFLERLIETCTDLEVEVATGLSQSEITAELAAGRLDLALMMGVPVKAEAYAHAVTIHAGRESILDGALRTEVLASRPVGLLVPANTPLARRRAVRAADLRGQRVAVLHAFHGEALCGPIRQHLAAAGAEAVLPPEPNAIGVERYGRQFNLPAITLGWFPQPVDSAMVRRPLAGLALETQLVLACHREVSTPAIERTFALARQLAEGFALDPT